MKMQVATPSEGVIWSSINLTALNQSAVMITLGAINTDYDKYPKAKPTNAERRHFCLHKYYSSYTTTLISISLMFLF